MDKKLDDLLRALNSIGAGKYYVYRLVDPRTLQTFYVGKGCGDRVFQHAKGVVTQIALDEDENKMSLKEKQIAEIVNSGKEVISIIHRRGLTNKEALEVEAALIDAYPGLANIQRGYGTERGAMSTEDLYALYNTPIYDEPSEKYVIIKTTPQSINTNGSLYEATRKSWHATLVKAKKYEYVFAVVGGIVREVYKVNKDNGWYQISDDRIAFNGEPTNDSISLIVKNKRIPDYYKKRGAANPFMYKK